MNHIVEEYLNGVSKYGMEGTIVLTPTHYDKGTPSGYLCKNRVNAAIQAIVNPKTDDKLCVEIGKQLFMVGDRIIQRKTPSRSLTVTWERFNQLPSWKAMLPLKSILIRKEKP